MGDQPSYVILSFSEARDIMEILEAVNEVGKEIDPANSIALDNAVDILKRNGCY
jgi:hypothetical protein